MTDQIAFSGYTAGCRTLADDTLRITLDIDPKHAAEAFKHFGARGVSAAIAPLSTDAQLEQGDPAENHGQFWSALFKCGFFRHTDVLRAIGPESKFEEWIRCQPAVIGADDYDSKTGDIRNQVAHVRRVREGAGTAEKPPYFAVPLSASAHREQHQGGEFYLLDTYKPKDSPGWQLDDAKEWFDKKADQYRTDWASNELARQLKPDYQSRSEISPDQVVGWADKRDLIRFIPNGWRGRG